MDIFPTELALGIEMNKTAILKSENRIDDLAFITYTHSDYSDLWQPSFSNSLKYFDAKNKYLFTDKINDFKAEDFKCIYYDDKLLYNKRVLNCLEKINEKYCLFLHEDMILYSNVDKEKINYIFEFLQNNSKYKFFRLIKSGINSSIKLQENIYELNKQDFLFSITPTIWETKFLKEVAIQTPESNIWNFELNGCRFLYENDINGCYWYNNEPKRGSNHYDSNLFPHICSAIFKGKWNMEYKKELDIIFKEFFIDKNIRGTIF